jgi:hypothetical protein
VVPVALEKLYVRGVKPGLEADAAFLSVFC